MADMGWLRTLRRIAREARAVRERPTIRPGRDGLALPPLPAMPMLGQWVRTRTGMPGSFEPPPWQGSTPGETVGGWQWLAQPARPQPAPQARASSGSSNPFRRSGSGFDPFDPNATPPSGWYWGGDIGISSRWWPPPNSEQARSLIRHLGWVDERGREANGVNEGDRNAPYRAAVRAVLSGTAPPSAPSLPNRLRFDD